VTVLVTATTPVFEIVNQTQFPDTRALVVGGTDATKKLRFEVDGITTATTRVITMPDKDVTLADATDSTGGLVELATTAEVQTGTDTSRAVTPAAMQNGKLIVGTPVATTSGTSVSLSTTIPSWAKRITLLFNGVSLSGTSDILVQVGGSGGFENTSYVSESTTTTASATGVSTSTAGFIVRLQSATNVATGKVLIELTGTSNTWIATHSMRHSTTSTCYGAGSKATSATLDRVQVASANGSDTFDAGDITVAYE
jgi:hypothetical protein